MEERRVNYKKTSGEFLLLKKFICDINNTSLIWQNFDEMMKKYEIYEKTCGVIEYNYGNRCGNTISMGTGFFMKEEPKLSDDYIIKKLPEEKILYTYYNGDYADIRKEMMVLVNYYVEHGLVFESGFRVVVLDKENNKYEIQTVIHDWNKIFAEKIASYLGEEAMKDIMEGSEKFDHTSSKEEKIDWIKGAIDILDRKADEKQKYAILSSCADKFSNERIEYLKSIYKKNNNIDDVLKEMEKDPLWYNFPRREGNIIYEVKAPFDPEAFKNAKTELEKKRSYCHCILVRQNIETMQPTYCYCGAGWYRQIWEGILEKKIRIEIVKSLTKGDECCEFALYINE